MKIEAGYIEVPVTTTKKEKVIELTLSPKEAGYLLRIVGRISTPANAGAGAHDFRTFNDQLYGRLNHLINQLEVDFNLKFGVGVDCIKIV